ncbi:MAG: trigger factor [Nitrospirae bacterium]|nr:trigger factor [Nitrospirota bacterium]
MNSFEYTIETPAATEKTIRIQVPPGKVDEAIKQQFARYRTELKIPGFRPGKIPLDLLERDYGDAIREEARWALVNEVSKAILEENKIDPFTPPKADPPALKVGEAFAFDVSVEIRPQIADVVYKGLEVRKEEPKVTDFELNEELDRLRKAHYTMKVIEENRKPKPGDIVVIDLDGRLDGKPFKGGTGQDIQAEVGTGFFEKRFEEELVTMNRGDEREVDLPFAADHWDKTVAGKSVHFRIKLKELKEKVLPELNDEFAQSYLNETGLEPVKAKLQERLLERAKDRARQKMKSDLTTRLVEKNPVDVPRSLLDMHRARIAQNVARDMLLSGLQQAQVEQMVKEREDEIDTAARREAAAMLLLEFIGKKEALRLERKDVEAHFQRLAAVSQSNLEVVKRYYQDDRRARELAAALMEEKILELMLAHAIMAE